MVYLGNFTCKKDVLNEFACAEDELKNCKVLLAWYGYGDYDGSAFVLFEKNGQLYEVNGGHCSCYGLEGQFEPEETTVEALRHRIQEGYLGQSDYYDEGVFDVSLKKILTRWENSRK